MAAAVFRLLPLAAMAAIASCTSVRFAPLSFESLPWRVDAINGEDTPMVDNYRMEFAKGRLTARFGCNHFGGSYRVQRNQLVVAQLAGTRMRCPDPTRDFENRATAILRSPMQIGRNPKSGGTLLSNAAGSLELAPIVTGKRL